MKRVILLTVKCPSCGLVEDIGVGDEPRARDCRRCGEPLKTGRAALLKVKTINDRRRKERSK